MKKSLETLEIIDAHGIACATELAKSLGISTSAFSNRAKPLLEKAFVQKTSSGKNRLYSITESGKVFLKNNQDIDKPIKKDIDFIETLETLLENNFDNTYCLIDIFFDEPFSSITTYYMQGNVTIDPRDPLVLKLYHGLTNYICNALYQNFTKKQFIDYLNSTGSYSYKVKGIIYYIANKYDEAIKK